MNSYKSKIVNYGYKEKVIIYDNPITIGESINTDIERQKYQDMDSEKQKLSEQRRIRYYKKAIKEWIKIAMMNDYFSTTVKHYMYVTDTMEHRSSAYETAIGSKINNVFNSVQSL